jgi:superfamily II DNA helicase RecQ
MVECLRALRSELAAKNSVPAYVIFSNKTMEAIARACPQSTEELAAVPGIGPGRLSDYGEKILAALNSR